MDNKMETTIVHLGVVFKGLYRGYMGIMEIALLA